MKRLINRPIKGEKGQVLILSLVLLFVGMLIVVPLLAYMSAGLISGQVHEQRMEELYAADAGFEYALYQIMEKHEDLPQADDEPDLELDIAGGINYKQVEDIIVEYIDYRTYRVDSTAIDLGRGSSTNIESYVHILSFVDFMNNAITSMADINIQPNAEVWGDVHYDASNGELDDKGIIHDDEIETGPVVGWPTVEELIEYYWPYVSGLDPFEDDEIDLKDTDTIPSLYRVGDLTIKNTGAPGASGTFEGIVYVDGDVEFAQPGNKDYDIYLNGWTIFALGEIRVPSDRCTLHGPGCIVAVGDIQFQPKMASVDDEFEDDLIFVMSVLGTVTFQPNGDFYGSVAGNVDVGLQPGTSLRWNGPPPELKFPGAELSEWNVIHSIPNWQINLQ